MSQEQQQLENDVSEETSETSRHPETVPEFEETSPPSWTELRNQHEDIVKSSARFDGGIEHALKPLSVATLLPALATLLLVPLGIGSLQLVLLCALPLVVSTLWSFAVGIKSEPPFSFPSFAAFEFGMFSWWGVSTILLALSGGPTALIASSVLLPVLMYGFLSLNTKALDFGRMVKERM